MRKSLRLARPLALLAIAAIIVFEVYGEDMLKSRIYIPEAQQPEGFPSPGKVGEIVVKSYPAYRAAVVERSDSGQDQMFGLLFNHIKKNKIKMTAPVELKFDSEGENSMAFLYRSSDTGKLGKDGPVKVIDVPATQVVSVGVRGDYSKERWEKNRVKLDRWLAENSEWEASGPSRYFGFNSPFVPKFLRYGEIQIPIRKRK